MNVPGRPASATTSPPTLRAQVVHAPGPRQVVAVTLELPAGATVLQALQHPGVQRQFAQLDMAALSLTVWGRKASPAQPVRDNDRIELLRGLRVDPKVARRERFQKQGASQAGPPLRKS